MSRYRRAKGGKTFFFTVVTYKRKRILCLDVSREVLRQVISELKRSRPFTVEAWVLLPDHIHCIWTLPEGDADYSMRWGWIKKEFTKRIRMGCVYHANPNDVDQPMLFVGTAHPTVTASRVSHRDGTIWQRRFWEHMIRDEGDFRSHCDYIHFSPVKHGIVQRARDWPYSTFHQFVERGTYPESWGGSEIPFPDGVGGE